VLKSQLKENKENCEKIKDEIVSLKKELEKITNQLNKNLNF
jgi:chromosome segregation ATPase